MTEDTTPENLRKFLESDDPALVMMGLSMAKGTGAANELLPSILEIYFWNPDKVMRNAAKSAFTKSVSNNVNQKIKKYWKHYYRKSFLNISEEKPGFGLTSEKVDNYINVAQIFLKNFNENKLENKLGTVILYPILKEIQQIKKGLFPTREDLEILMEIGDPRSVENVTYYEDSLIQNIKNLNPPLTKESDYNDFVSYSADVLGLMKSEKAIDSLVNLMRLGNKRTTQKIIKSLGLIGSKKAVKPLENFLNAIRKRNRNLKKVLDKNIDDEGIANTIINALANIGNERSLELFFKILEEYNENDTGVEFSIMYEIANGNAIDNSRTLSKFDNIKNLKYKKRLRKLLSHESDVVKTSIAELLGELGDKSYGPDLVKALDDIALVPIAAYSLGQLKYYKAEDKILEIIKNERTDDHGWYEPSLDLCVRTLGIFKSRKSVEILTKILEKNAVTNGTGLSDAELFTALGNIGDKKAIPYIEEASSKAKHPNDFYKKALKESLEKLNLDNKTEFGTDQKELPEMSDLAEYKEAKKPNQKSISNGKQNYGNEDVKVTKQITNSDNSIPTELKSECKILKIRLTKTVKGKRIRKTKDELEKDYNKKVDDLKEKCRKLKVRLTKNINGKRVYKMRGELQHDYDLKVKEVQEKEHQEAIEYIKHQFSRTEEKHPLISIIEFIFEYPHFVFILFLIFSIIFSAIFGID